MKKAIPQSSGRAPATVLVLGGGIVGVTTAYYLQSRGFQVTLIEKNAELGDGTSRANAGLVSVGCSQPWNSPAVPMTVLKTWGRKDSPYLFRASAFPAIIPWAIRFLLNCRSDTYLKSSISSVELVGYSLDQYKATSDQTGISFDRQQNGVLKYFQDPAAVRREQRDAEVLAPYGMEYRMMNSQQIVDLEPALAPHRDRIAGGLYFSRDESGDSKAFSVTLAERCRSAGVRFATGTTIKSFALEKGQVRSVVTDRGNFSADKYVLCLGAESARFGQMLKLKLPVYPVKGYSVTIATDGSLSLPKVPFLDWGRKICVTRFGDRIRAAGTAEFCGHDTTPTPARWCGLHNNLIELFPALAEIKDVTPWAGLRPVTPDGMPILGKSPIENVFLNVGHGPQGWGLSCGSAAVVADIVAGRKPEIDVSMFDYARN